MKKNIGTRDRIMRLVMGVVCIAVALLFVSSMLGKTLLILVGVFCVFQAAMSWCLWYQITGKNTCPTK